MRPSFQVAVVDPLRPSSFVLRPGPLRVGLRVPALSQGSLPIGVTDTGYRELPLTVSPSWSEAGRRVARPLRTESWS
jgi:hypothetical protein